MATLTRDAPTADRQAQSSLPPRPCVPPLENGDHLAREEFHRRYEAMGDGVRAELIEGVVYLRGDGNTNGTRRNDVMPSPVSLLEHGTPHYHLGGWMFLYSLRTPGLFEGSDSSVFLDGTNEPQPDLLLGIPESAGGQTRIVRRGQKHYAGSAPELVAEVAASTVAIDLNAKLRAYERNGVREYVVVLPAGADAGGPPEVRWLVLENGRFTPLAADDDGLLKSRAFPGLWLDAAALLAGDLPKLAAAVDAGCETAAGRAAFLDRLAV